jgi:hypothetical protein
LESDTRYLTHGIHRYSGKFIPQIAGQVIEMITEPGELVLDPYAGSGTSLLEAGIRGRRSIGVDINPLACLISSVKTTAISPDLLEPWASRLTRAIAEHSTDQLSLLGGTAAKGVGTPEQDYRWSDPNFVKWFPEERLRELLLIDHLIQGEERVELRNVARLALSDILRQSSMANTSYPNVMYDKRKKSTRPAIPKFLRQLDDVISAVSELTAKLPAESAPVVLRGSATNLPLRDASVDAVVTHPPYIGSVPYAEYGRLSLMWLGEDPLNLDKRLTGGRRQSRDVVDRFRHAFDEMIAESRRVMRAGAYLVMLLGSPTVRSERIDLPNMARSLTESHGFVLEAEIDRSGGNRRANLMAKETLLFFRKPS